MPATTPNPSSAPRPVKSREDWTPPAYLSIDLSNEQKARLADWVKETEYVDLLAWIDEMVKLDHNLSIKVNKKAVFVSLLGTTSKSGHINVCLTNRASSVEKALFGLMFRGTEVTAGNWEGAQTVVDDY